VLQRDLRIAIRRWSDLTSPLMFFLMVGALFPLAVSPEASVLRQIGPGVSWVAALLATLLSLNSMFRSDFEDGSLEQLALSPHPLSLLLTGKVLAHWLVTAVPLIILAPALGISYDLSAEGIQTLMLALLLGTPALNLVGSVGAALTVGIRQGNAILSLLVLPLAMPVLVFGARATDIAATGGDPSGGLYLLAAMSVLALTLAPFATAAAVRVSLD
jgi:heme exporter protein B